MQIFYAPDIESVHELPVPVQGSAAMYYISIQTI